MLLFMRGSFSSPSPVTRWVMLGCVALSVPLLVPLLTGTVFTRDDLAALHLPFRHLYRESLLAGEFLLWTPAYRSGFYLHGAGEAGMAHPLHMLLYGVLPLGVAFNLEIIASYAALLLGTRLLLRQLGLSGPAAWFGGMTFAFSGFTLFNLMHVNHIATLAHAPWILLGAHQVMLGQSRHERGRGFATMAVACGSQWLTGNPQYVWLTLVALAYFVGGAVIARGRPIRLVVVAGALGVGILIGAVQLLPTLEFLADSTRLAWSLDQSLSFSLSPWNLVQLWSPFAFRFRVNAPASESQIVHEFIVYNGAFCTMTLAWLAIRWREQHRRWLVVALLGFAGINLLLAFGSHGGVYPWLAQLPGLRSLRAPARHLALFQLALSGLAAVAFEDLTELAGRGERVGVRRLWPILFVIALSVITTVIGSALSGSTWAATAALDLSGFWRAAPWSALVVGMGALMFAVARGMPRAVPALILLAAFDQGLWGYSYAYRWGPRRTVSELAANAPVPPQAAFGDVVVPAIDGGIGNTAILRGIHLTTGYTGLTPASELDPAERLTQRLAGAKWRHHGQAWVAATDSMPRARLVAAAHASNNIAADLQTIDIARVALVDHALDIGGLPGTAAIVVDLPGTIIVETEAPSPQLLVLTERFHRGWRMSEDGVDGKPLRVYGDFLAAPVLPGRHRLVFSFQPSTVTLGWWTSAGGLAIVLGTIAVLLRRVGDLHLGQESIRPVL